MTARWARSATVARRVDRTCSVEDAGADGTDNGVVIAADAEDSGIGGTDAPDERVLLRVTRVDDVVAVEAIVPLMSVTEEDDV